MGEAGRIGGRSQEGKSWAGRNLPGRSQAVCLASWFLAAFPCPPSETCKKEAGEDFAKYVTLGQKGDKWFCITPCSSGYSTSKNCSYGKCQLQRSGPRCL